MPSCISLLVLLYTAIYSFITTFLFIQSLQKIRLAKHIHSLGDLLHVDAIQQLEVALVGSPAATLLDVLLMNTQHQAALLQSNTVPPQPLAASSILFSHPSVPIAGMMDTVGLADAKATSSKIPAPKPSTEAETMSSKCWHIILTPIAPTTLRFSSLPPQLPIVVVPELAIPVSALPM